MSAIFTPAIVKRVPVPNEIQSERPQQHSPPGHDDRQQSIHCDGSDENLTDPDERRKDTAKLCLCETLEARDWY